MYNFRGIGRIDRIGIFMPIPLMAIFSVHASFIPTFLDAVRCSGIIFSSVFLFFHHNT